MIWATNIDCSDEFKKLALTSPAQTYLYGRWDGRNCALTLETIAEIDRDIWVTNRTKSWRIPFTQQRGRPVPVTTIRSRSIRMARNKVR
jgi:hypothetical protein